ncbi:hypothetical protein Bbelb_394980 [Branchiostoma belcheri]|nr:hypothetical protein Bbelb_394980 [Branchiostoma belcheri]
MEADVAMGELHCLRRDHVGIRPRYAGRGAPASRSGEHVITVRPLGRASLTSYRSFVVFVISDNICDLFPKYKSVLSIGRAHRSHRQCAPVYTFVYRRAITGSSDSCFLEQQRIPCVFCQRIKRGGEKQATLFQYHRYVNPHSEPPGTGVH